jgi:hypothetical protein
MRRAALLGALGIAACAPAEDAYYARLETDLRAAGFMRTDRAPRDARFTNADLVRNFQLIALYSEYGRTAERFVRERSETVLSKWTGPVRVGLVFGRSVPDERRATDTADVTGFMARLAALTGLDIRLSSAGGAPPNFVVIFANRAERTEIAAEIARTNRDADPAFLDSLANSPTSEICYVNTFWDAEQPGRTIFAVAVIKDETAGLMRLSCVHEELTQALGLGNDDERVRPSIFNDDEEFALLTEHDEYLLRMLYHPDLRPGMDAEEVAPLLPGIVAALRPEPG